MDSQEDNKFYLFQNFKQKFSVDFSELLIFFCEFGQEVVVMELYCKLYLMSIIL